MKSENLKYLIYLYWIVLVLVFGYAVFVQGRSPVWFFVMLLIAGSVDSSKETE